MVARYTDAPNSWDYTQPCTAQRSAHPSRLEENPRVSAVTEIHPQGIPPVQPGRRYERLRRLAASFMALHQCVKLRRFFCIS
eukprot:1224878-Amphidinium_carterae.2